MTLATGTKIGAFEILGSLGAGGMGEVYRATDTRLKRQVALKVLPAAVTTDPDRLARFQREAEVLAALNHPNIAAIYGVEETAAVRALVMELVEGPTLADRIAQGPIPLEEAIPLAKQIAEALEVAHEQGIIHRDLKPANIKLRMRGTPRAEDHRLERSHSPADVGDCVVKVLDFGLAKALEPTHALSSGLSLSPGLSQSPTIATPAMTQAGVILGTAAYMSPEQARGQIVDKRADLWAFGAVLYEMLTGARLFDGATISDTIAAVLTQNPDWTRLPSSTPGSIRRVLRRCLEKDRRRRIADAADVRLEIEDALAAPNAGDVPVARQRSGRLGWIAAGVSTAAIVALLVPVMRHVREAPPPEAPETRLEMTTPPSADPESLAISPDGRLIAFSADSGTGTRLFVRALDSSTARALDGTDEGRLPFWSPDGRHLGFFAHGQLKRIDISGGAPRTLAASVNPSSGTWSPEDVILFDISATATIQQIPASGGEAAPATRFAEGQSGHRAVRFLPDGRHFLFSVTGSAETRGVYLGTLGSIEAKRLLEETGSASVAGRHLFFSRGTTLFAQPFDVERVALSGTPMPIVQHPHGVAFQVSTTGTVIHRTGSPPTRRQLLWFDRTGREVGRFAEAFESSTTNLGADASLSPNGQRVAYGHSVVDGNNDVWLMDTRGGTVRMTSHSGVDLYPIWSPDGRSIVFESYANGRTGDIYRKALDGASDQELLVTTPHPKLPTSWSSDGQFILYHEMHPQSGLDVWALPLPDAKPIPIARTNFEEKDGQFSPDGRWITYSSTESGRREVYVQAFPGPGGRQAVSTGGGKMPRWSANGRELFYVAGDGRLTAVTVRPASDGPVLDIGARVPLFTLRLSRPFVLDPVRYAPSPDGQRFLVNVDVEDSATTPIGIILNWRPQAQ